jgi:hypothetical protein
MGRRPLPAVRDFTREGRWSTYDVSVLKLYNVSFRGSYHHQQNSPGWVIFLQQLSKPDRAPCRPGVLYVQLYIYVFSLVQPDGRPLVGSYKKCTKLNVHCKKTPVLFFSDHAPRRVSCPAFQSAQVW